MASTLVALLAGCARPHADGLVPARVEQLSFGRNIGMTTTEGVTDSLWAVFVHDVLNPAFPDGASVLSGVGYWQEKPGGPTVHERGFVVSLSVQPGARTDSLVRCVMDEYKKRFQQLAVGRTSFDVRTNLAPSPARGTCGPVK